MDDTQKKSLVAERVTLHTENKTLLDTVAAAKRTLTTEEQAQYDARDVRMTEIRATLDRVEKTEAEERLQAAANEEQRRLASSRGRRALGGDLSPEESARLDADLAFRAWAAGEKATPEQLEAAERIGVDVRSKSIDMATVKRTDEQGREVRSFVPVRATAQLDILEKRALSVGTTTAGGNSVQNEMMRAYYEVQKWYAQARTQATVFQTETGATLPYPTVTDTSNTGEIISEANTATTTADPTFGVVNLGAFKFSSKAVLVSNELIQDSFMDLPTWLGTALGRRIGRIQNTKFTIGAGTTEPKGFVVGATTSAAAATNAFTLDEIITLIHALDPAYRGMPGTGFTVHDTIAAYLRKFKDGQGRYMWEPSLLAGQPDRFFGYPMGINNDMDSALTTGKKLVYFGNLKLALVVRDAGATRFIRSDQRYVLEDLVAFLAWQRSDSNVIDTTAGKVLTLA